MCSKLAAALSVILLGSCAGRPSDRPQRVAVLLFENLTSDSKLDWLGTAAAAALVSDLAGLPKLYPFRVDSLRSAYAGRASQVMEASFEVVGDQLQIHASLEDLQRRKIERLLTFSGALRDGIIPLVNQLAHAMDANARVFSTRDPAAFRSYGEALSSRDAGSQARLLQAASEQDPAFSASLVNLSEALLLTGDRARAAQTAASAAQHATHAIDKLQLQLISALARGDLGERETALTRLSQATPADPDVYRNLAQAHLSERKYAEAVRDLQAAARVDPTDPATFNSLGYAQAYVGDAAGARQSLNAYRSLAAEGDVNPLDSLGEVSFYLGDFSAAERFFLEAHKGDPGLRGGFALVKAAQARLMTGDRSGADTIFAQYLDLRKAENRSVNEFQHAQWEWLTGRRKQALNRMQTLLSAAQGDVAALLHSQLAVWSLQIGDRPASMQHAQEATAKAVTPGLQNLAGLCRLLAAPAPQRTGNDLVDAYAFIFASRFTDAVPLLEKLYRQTAPEADAQVRTLLGWAYTKTGRTSGAANLIALYPIPLTGVEDIFPALIFPRFLQVRSVVLESQGKHDEAQRLARLYTDYSGDLPDKL